MNQKTIFRQLSGKEYLLQRRGNYYRCISWHPHYITTEWVTRVEKALEDGDEAIAKYYSNIDNDVRKNFRKANSYSTCYTCKHVKAIDSDIDFDNLYCGLFGKMPPERDINNEAYWNALERFLDNYGVYIDFVCDNYEEVNGR